MAAGVALKKAVCSSVRALPATRLVPCARDRTYAPSLTANGRSSTPFQPGQRVGAGQAGIGAMHLRVVAAQMIQRREQVVAPKRKSPPGAHNVDRASNCGWQAHADRFAVELDHQPQHAKPCTVVVGLPTSPLEEGDSIGTEEPRAWRQRAEGGKGSGSVRHRWLYRTLSGQALTR